MDLLEADSSLSLLSSRERRAAIISGLWLQHGERLREASPAGSLAAFLRAAHFASDTMLSDDCLDPFNERCAELRATYVRATAEVMATLRSRGWSPPDMSPTRYRLSTSAEGAPLSLTGLQLAPDTSRDESGDFSRPGVGLATAACHSLPSRRPAAHTVSICAPLTFVLSFDSSPETERSAAVLTAYDAFQRDLVRFDGRDVPLAADLLAAWRLLQQKAESQAGASLACVSPPSPDEVTVVGLVVPSPQDSAWVERYAALSRRDDVRSRFGFCVFPLGAREAPDRLSRQLLGLLRQAALSNAAERLVIPRSELFLVPEGDRGARTAAALLAQVQRSGRSPRARALRQGAFAVRGVYPIALPSGPLTPEAPAALADRARDAGVPLHAPAQESDPSGAAKSVAQLQEALGADTRSAATAGTLAGREVESTTEPLQVSPVL